MEQKPTFVAVDPVTDQVLWVCSGPDPHGRCPVAEKPPYVCHGLKLVAAHGTKRDGYSFVVQRTIKGHCPVAGLV
jgi:hypothetical protein